MILISAEVRDDGLRSHFVRIENGDLGRPATVVRGRASEEGALKRDRPTVPRRRYRANRLRGLMADDARTSLTGYGGGKREKDGDEGGRCRWWCNERLEGMPPFSPTSSSVDSEEEMIDPMQASEQQRSRLRRTGESGRAHQRGETRMKGGARWMR